MEGDILNLAHNMRSDMTTKPFRCKKIDGPPEQFFKEKGKLHEIIKRFLPWLKLYQHIDITLVIVLFAHKRAKNTKAFHAQCFNLLLMFGNKR